MFKKLLLGAALLISVNAFAQTQAEAQASKETTKEAQQLTLAGQLVKYGYENEDALALVQALKIYQGLNSKQATDGMTPNVVDEGEAQKGVTKEEQAVRNEKQIIADATNFAKGDKNLLALIDGVKNAKRDPVGGAILRYFRLPARSTHDWSVTLRGGERTIVEVSGDGTTDLDLYVYDQYGRLIASDTSYGDDCAVAIDVFVTSTFTVRVKNLGYVYNDYVLAIY